MNEPSNKRPGDIAEAELRDLYRELAVETTPPALDARILADARAALPARRVPSRNWMRPLAVAATLGLCVALVVEIGTGPGGSVPMVPEPLPDTREDVGNAARESRAQKMGETKAAKSLPAASSFSDAVAAPAERPARVDTNTADAPAYGARERDAADAPSAAIPRQADRSEAALLEEAVVPATASAPDATSAGARLSVDDDGRGCDEHATRDPARWLECIEALEAAGEPERAASERRHRRAAFPDAD